MNYIEIGGEAALRASQIGVGCMRFNRLTMTEAVDYLNHTQQLGINFFDHADIYGKGSCETLFGRALKQTSIEREQLIIQSKCGIQPGFYDSSKAHILASVDQILHRLGVDYLDILALHRPDALIEPEEVAEAFKLLRESGKVKFFGVSNFHPLQIELLKKTLPSDMPLVVNQLQFGLMANHMVAEGIHVNRHEAEAVNRDGYALDYARLHQMTVQAWSPYQHMTEGLFIDQPEFPEINALLSELADKYQTTKTGIVTAWNQRHPANIQTLAGTMTKERLTEIANSSHIVLSRADWYALYQASGHVLP